VTEQKEKLQRAAHAVSTAAMLLKMERETIDAFLKECRDMENFGSIIDPPLYKNPERRAVSALMEPLFEAATQFIAVYDRHLAEAAAALKKVTP
jgi:hypothetical protein